MFERTGWFRVRTHLVNLCMLTAQFSSSLYPLFSGNLSDNRNVNQQQIPFSLGLGLWSICSPSCPMARTLGCSACLVLLALCVFAGVFPTFPTGRHTSLSSLLCPSLPLFSIQSFLLNFLHNPQLCWHDSCCWLPSTTLYFFPCGDHEDTRRFRWLSAHTLKCRQQETTVFSQGICPAIH